MERTQTKDITDFTDINQLNFTDFGIDAKKSSFTFQNLVSQPLTSWGISKSRIDNGISDGSLKGSVLLEIKDYKDITQPKQRFEDDKSKEVDPDELARASQKNFSSYLFTVYDGVRDIKMMILQDKSQLEFFRIPIRQDSKYRICNCSYIKNMLIIRDDTQITLLHEGEAVIMAETKESETTGLNIKETGAPKFVEL
mmetsp:Transcript_22966/g.25494  ORF Transcript_22966/g.25494 Transcript_22966/m.25494 type:complete len:197 (+) Transcript_22966:3-593(+)